MHAFVYLFIYLRKKLPKVHMAIGLGPNHPHPFEEIEVAIFGLLDNFLVKNAGQLTCVDYLTMWGIYPKAFLGWQGPNLGSRSSKV
jgi:hypothetical protein